jgi:uncharacterized protein
MGPHMRLRMGLPMCLRSRARIPIPRPGDYPPGAYPPPTGYGQRPPMAPHDERTWAMWAHLGALLALFLTGFLGWVPPLVIMQTRGRDSAFVRGQAVESLNFQLTLIIATVAGVILFVLLIWTVIIPILILIAWLAIGIGALVFMIMASVAGNRGEPYRYPVNFRLVS